MKPIKSFLFCLVALVSLSAKSQTQSSANPAQPSAESTISSAAPVPPPWHERISISGDFRFRTENIVDQGLDTRFRNRILARLGIIGKVNDRVNATIRLASAPIGTENVVSYNVTMGGTSDKKPVWIDLAFLDWKALPALSVQAGKVPNPFFAPGKQQMIWDSDVTLEGVLTKYTSESGSLRLFATLGGLWIAEQQATTANTQSQNDGLTGAAQIGAGYKTDSLSGSFAVSYYHHQVEGTTPNFTEVPGATANLKGNSVDASNRYLFNYDQINGGLELGTERLPLPLTIYADYVVNAGPENENVGQIYGIRVGKLKDPGSWAFDYNYRDVERDALLAIYADGDFGGGGTDVLGNRFNLLYQAAQNVVASATYIGSENSVSTAKGFYERAQLDFTVSF